MGKFIFDGPTLTIEGDPLAVINGVFQFTATEIYSEWVDWVAQSDNLKYPPAFSTVGGDPLGGGQYIGGYIFIRNDLGWRLKPPDVGSIQVVIDGNFYSQDSNTATFIPYSGVLTTILMRVSQMTQGIVTGGGIGTVEEVRDAVWNAQLTSYQASGSIGEYLYKKLLTVAKFIGIK